MKVLLILIQITVTVTVVICEDEDFFLKFHQDDYEVKNIRSIVKSYNKQYFKEFTMTAFKCNRTTRLLNITIESVVDLTVDNLHGYFQSYRKYGTEFKIFPMRIYFNACHAISWNVLGFGNIKYGRLSCPFLKNEPQIVSNFHYDFHQLPPLIPDGEYLSTVNYTLESNVIAQVEVYATVYRKVKIL